jgi:hypothetical protein
MRQYKDIKIKPFNEANIDKKEEIKEENWNFKNPIERINFDKDQ